MCAGVLEGVRGWGGEGLCMRVEDGVGQCMCHDNLCVECLVREMKIN